VLFSNDDVQRALANFKRSGARYLLATTFPTVQENSDTQNGVWRPLNLEKGPFHLPRPIALINEKCTEAQGRYQDKSLGLWVLN
jgi:hypothetical protein